DARTRSSSASMKAWNICGVNWGIAAKSTKAGSMPMASTFFRMAKAPLAELRQRESLRSVPKTPLLLPQHDQGIGGIRHEPPLRIVVGLEPPGFAAIGHQHDLAALQPPLRRREGGNAWIAFRLEEHLEIVMAGVVVGERQAADDVAVAADHRPVADHLVHGFGQRPGGR